jgi:hypothetical protein
MMRNVTPVYGISQHKIHSKYFLGPLEVTGKITFIMETDAELNQLLNKHSASHCS